MFSQFFILSKRGDSIVLRDYRGDIIKNTPELFFRHVKSVKGDCQPFFFLDGITYIYIKTAGLYFVCTTKTNISPFTAVEMLTRLSKLFKDYCGLLTEEALRKNFVLIYELLDEALDYGYPQATSTELLKAYIYEEAQLVEDNSLSLVDNLNAINRKTLSSKASNKPLAMDYKARGANEVFIDLFEKITAVLSSSGTVLRAEIDGSLVMKCFLAGNPEIRLGLNEDIVVGRGRSATGYGRIVIDDINFHECCQIQNFARDKSLVFSPPDGEFTVFNYRISEDVRLPFKIFPFVEEVSSTRLDLILKIRADYNEDQTANNLVARIPVPRSTTNVSFELAPGVVGESTEFKPDEKWFDWTIKKFQGNSERTLRAKIQIPASEAIKATAKKEIGPINLSFELPMHTCSNIEIKFMRVVERGTPVEPSRWIRYITQSTSYVCRLK